MLRELCHVICTWNSDVQSMGFSLFGSIYQDISGAETWKSLLHVKGTLLMSSEQTKNMSLKCPVLDTGRGLNVMSTKARPKGTDKYITHCITHCPNTQMPHDFAIMTFSPCHNPLLTSSVGLENASIFPWLGQSES